MTKHPDDSEWMQFLYNESEPAVRTQLQTHLEQCSECFHRVEAWRATMGHLDSWTLSPGGASMVSAAVSLKPQGAAPRRNRSWTVLAVAVSLATVLLAFLAGRSLTAQQEIDIASLKATLRAELEQSITQQLRDDLGPVIKAEFAAIRPDDQTLLPLIATESSRVAVAAMANWVREDSVNRERIQQLLAGVLDNQVALRTDLENLAIEAEAQIVRTRRELVRLALSAQQASEVRGAPLMTPDGNEPPQL